VQGSKNKVSGLGCPHCGCDGLLVSHFSNEHYIGVLPHQGAEGVIPVDHVNPDFPLGDDGFFIDVEVFDGVFNGNNMLCACAVDMVDHGGDGRCFAAAGWAGNENQAVGIVSNCFYNRRQVKGFKRGNLSADASRYHADIAPLTEGVDAEAVHLSHLVGKIEGAVFQEIILLLVAHNLEDKFLDFLFRHGLAGGVFQLAVDAQFGGCADF